MATIADVVVIGGGLHGLSASLQLARAGLKVVVYERDWVGRHASGATAAGVRILNRALPEIPLALESNRMWHRIADMVDDPCSFHADGIIKVAETEEGLAELAVRRQKVVAAGYDHEEMISRDELFNLVPQLARHCIGGLMVRRDGAADPHRTVQAFRRAAERAGVVVREGTEVTAAVREGNTWSISAGGEACSTAVVINAAGAWGGHAARMLGDHIPMHHVTPSMVVTERMAPFLKPVLSVQGRKLSFKQSAQGTLLLGGGYQGVSDLESRTGRPVVHGLGAQIRTALDLFPTLETVRIARIWVGIEAETADHLPVIEASPRSLGVFHATGFSGHGFQLAPVVGRILTDLVTTGRTDLPIAPFASARLHAAA